MAHHWFEFTDILLRKEWTDCCTTAAVEFVVYRRECRAWEAELRNEEVISISWFVGGVKFLVVVRVVDMKLIGTYSDNWAFSFLL